MSGEIILILVLSNAYFSTPSNLHTAMKNFPYLILCSGQNTSLLIQVTLHVHLVKSTNPKTHYF